MIQPLRRRFRAFLQPTGQPACCAGREPSKQLRHPMDSPGHHSGREMVRAGHDIGDDFGFGGLVKGAHMLPRCVAHFQVRAARRLA